MLFLRGNGGIHIMKNVFPVVFLTEHASYVTKLTDLIKSRSSPDQSDVDDSANFVGFFPIFVWTLRDFPMELELNSLLMST